MAWLRNQTSEVTWEDSKGPIGEFGRGEDAIQTFVTLISPDGTEWYVVVDNLGTLSASTTKPVP